MFPGEGISPSETKISNSTEDKIAGIGSIKFASGLLWVLVNHPLIPGPINLVYEKKHHILDAYSKDSIASWRILSQPPRHCHLAGTVTESSKGHFTNLSS